MNVTEANAVARILQFVTDLSLFELAGQEDIEELQLPDDARFLARRVRQALGAGPDPDDVFCRVQKMLWLPENERPVEDVPVTGGRL